MDQGSLLLLLGVLTISFYYLLYIPLIRLCGSIVGSSLRKKTASRRATLLQDVESTGKAYEARRAISVRDRWSHVASKSKFKVNVKPADKKKENYDGIIGFLHPFCNAGGGGERVLWAAVRATQSKYPNALCVVYTGDHDVNKDQILMRVKERFAIDLYPPTITFLYLKTRHYVLASTWPRFTLIGQSLGSLVMAWDAFNLLVPDIFIDTMGYAFTLALSRFLFPEIPTGAYVHYPTISTDMLASLGFQDGGRRGLNAGSGRGIRGSLKKQYWHMFAYLYSWVGGSVDVVTTNSSWTQNHIQQLWGKARQRRSKAFPVSVVYPPVAVSEIEIDIPINHESEKDRKATLLYIAQFRPEKNHSLVMQSFAKFLQDRKTDAAAEQPTLLLVGSVRDATDEKYIYSLRLLAHELHITSSVKFMLNAKWDEIRAALAESTVGINAMWNEHFGIGVVEYQAAGLISVVNDSGGPKLDIVVDMDGEPTGFHASTAEEYAAGYGKALDLGLEEKVAMRLRARKSSKRFSEDVFDDQWIVHMEKLVSLTADPK